MAADDSDRRDSRLPRGASPAISDDVSQALSVVSVGLSQGLESVGQQIHSAIGLVEKLLRRSSAKGAALPVLQASVNGKLSVKEATAWLRSVQQKRSAVDRLSVFMDTLINDPCAYKDDAMVIKMLDPDDDCHLYHDIRGSIASARVFKKLGRSEGVLASLLLRNVFLSAVQKTPEEMALLIVEFYHNVQPVQNADYLYYLFEDWKDLLTEVRWAGSLSKEMVHQSAQVLLQRGLAHFHCNGHSLNGL